jgi:hypothetical protein
VAAVIDDGFIGSLNEAEMTATASAPSLGLVELTVGATVSTPGWAGFLSDDELQPTIATTSRLSDHAAMWRVRSGLGRNGRSMNAIA